MIETFYFGREHQLFGILNSSSENRGCGVILCPPVGQEYIRTFRTFSLMAGAYEREGFDVFRFDYYGCGDSSGNFEDISMQHLTNSLLDAIDEFVESNYFEKVIFVGLRLGANIVLEALKTRELNCETQIVLWNPITSGKQYIEESKRKFNKWIIGSFVKMKYVQKEEIFGFNYSPQFLEDISNIELRTDHINDKNILIINNSSGQLNGNSLYSNRQKLNLVCIPEPEFWNKNEEESKSLIPQNSINEIIKFSSLTVL